MTAENYEVILNTIAESIKKKDNEISLLKWQLEDAQKKLADAEQAATKNAAVLDGVLCKKKIEYREDV